MNLAELVFVVVSALLLNLVTSNGIKSVMTNRVEFRTEAPKDLLTNKQKDCYEFLHGRLSEIRRHGTTWQNGVSDCSNCTCDNGDIRCFFHFCKGPSTGYMTPPSTNTEDDMLGEESSGYPPPGLIDDDGAYDDEDNKAYPSDKKELNHISKDNEVRPNTIVTDVPVEFNEIVVNHQQPENKKGHWPPKILPEKWQKEQLPQETSSFVPLNFEETHQAKNKEKKNRAENETHNVIKSHFCGKTCKKVCHRGYEIDPLFGCWKCKCIRCVSSCVNKCTTGYVLDDQGCETCTCLTLTTSADEDITFNEDPQDDLQLVHEYVSTILPEEKVKSLIENQDNIEFLDEDYMNRIPVPLPEEPNTVPAAVDVATTTVQNFDLIQDMFQTVKTEEEPCNTTESRGCLDGSRKFPVGGVWPRGPCVFCRCVAPGYSECNITQCRILESCPNGRRFTPKGACCPLCKDASSGAHPLPPPELHQKATTEDTIQLDEPFLGLDNDDDATIKSLAKEDQSTLLAILIPVGIFCGLVVFFLMHMWRRYHSDKYDINSYRPEEKQQLRPVKTLHDDQASLKHV